MNPKEFDMSMTQTRSGWRVLAEPTYATSRYGRTVQLPAGIEICVTANILLWDGTVAARVGFPFETEAEPRNHQAACWYVTASALRFVEDE